MMMVIERAVAKMSLVQFLAHPGDTFHDFHELHDGEIVEVQLPIAQHIRIQRRIEVVLNQHRTAPGYVALREFYIVLPTEARRVDVALTSTAHTRQNGFLGARNSS